MDEKDPHPSERTGAEDCALPFPEPVPPSARSAAPHPEGAPRPARRPKTTVATGAPPGESNTAPWRRRNPIRCRQPGRRNSETHFCSDWRGRNPRVGPGESDNGLPVEDRVFAGPTPGNGATPPPGSRPVSPRRNPPSPASSALQFAQRRTVDGHRVAVMPHTTQQRIHHRFITQKAMPLVIDQVSRDNRRVTAIPFLHQLEEDIRLFWL